jgi:hypothetical protein
MRRLAVFLACCVVALVAFILLRPARQPRQRPVLVVEDGRSGSSGEIQRLSSTFATCPGVVLGFSPNVAGTNYYHLLMSWSENRWEGYLFQDTAEQEYVIWAGSGVDYNALLKGACSRISDDEGYVWPGLGGSTTSETARYDLHDLRNGNIATSAILDRKTGRVWEWTYSVDKFGRTNYFVEDELHPNPNGQPATHP